MTTRTVIRNTRRLCCLALFCCGLHAHAQTQLFPGDIAIIGADFSATECNGAFSGNDIIAFVTFVDITTGTEIILTDYGFLTDAGDYMTFRTRTGAAQDGVIRFTRTGATIPANSIFYLATGNATLFCPAAAPECGCGWSTTELSPGVLNFVTSAPGDQLFVVQGTWTEQPTISELRGRIVFGIATAPWEPGMAPLGSVGTCSTNVCSYLPPKLKCSNALFSGSLDHGVYNVSPVTSGLQMDIVKAISDPAHWSTNPVGLNCAALAVQDMCGFNMSAVSSLVFNATRETPGVWKGGASTDWYDPCNWSNLVLPDSSIDVLISPAHAAVNSCVIDPTSPLYTGTVSCRNLTIDAGARTLTMNGAATLRVFGDWSNAGTSNFTANGASTVVFKGSAAQAFSSTRPGGETYVNLTIQNASAAGVTLQSRLNVGGVLRLKAGVVHTGANTIYITNGAPDAIRNPADAMMTENDDQSYIHGEVDRALPTDGVYYPFPVGDDPAGKGYQCFKLRFEAGAVRDYTALAVKFIPAHTGTPPLTRECDENISDYDNWIGNGRWIVNGTPAAPPNLGLYTVQTFPNNFDPTLIPLNYTRYTGNAAVTLAKAPNGTTNWAYDGECEMDNSQLSGARPMVMRLNYNNGFSEFAAVVDRDAPFAVTYAQPLTARPLRRTILLAWRTATESEHGGFEVQRSADNGATFVPIGFVQPATTLRYGFEDADVRPFQRYFYRLAAVDRNGRRVLSRMVEAMLTDAFAAPAVRFYPNPTDGDLTVETGVDAAQLTVYDLTGKAVAQATLHQAQARVELGHLPAGVYVLRVIGADFDARYKVVKE